MCETYGSQIVPVTSCQPEFVGCKGTRSQGNFHLTFLIALANICFVTFPLADTACGAGCPSCPGVRFPLRFADGGAWAGQARCRGTGLSGSVVDIQCHLGRYFPPGVAARTAQERSIRSWRAEERRFRSPRLCHSWCLLRGCEIHLLLFENCLGFIGIISIVLENPYIVNLKRFAGFFNLLILKEKKKQQNKSVSFAPD